MSAWCIVPAGAESAAVLAMLHTALLEEAWSAESIADVLRLPGAGAFLALHGGGEQADDGCGGNARPVGFALSLTAGDDMEILAVGVVPEYRRKGVGTALVDTVLARARDAAARGVVLEVAEDNMPARRLYEALGFAVVGRRRGYYRRRGARRLDALIMGRALDAAVAEGGDVRGERGRELAIGRRLVYTVNSRKTDETGPVMPSRLEKMCLDKGLKMTEQRRVIARVLSESTDHPDVEQVYRRATEIDPRISIATVYRTVRLFEEASILDRHDFGDGRARYEEVPEFHHDHLIDVNSGEVIEFHNEEIEALQREVARKLGFELVDHRLELFGVRLPQDRGSSDEDTPK